MTPPFGEQSSAASGQTRSGCLAARGRTRGFGECSAPSRSESATAPPAGRTTPATVYKCTLVNKGFTACPRISAVLRPSSAAPGRWDRAIRNALTSTPGRSRARGKMPSKMAPRSIRRRGAGLAFLVTLFVLQKSSGGSQAAGSPSGLLRARLFFCFAWAVLSLCISLSPLAASSSRA